MHHGITFFKVYSITTYFVMCLDVSSKNQDEENGRNENSCLPSTEPNCELVANLTLNDLDHIQEFERPNVEDRTEAKETTECAEDSLSDTQVADTELRMKKGKKKKKRKDKASDNSKVQLQRDEDSVTEVSVEQNLSPGMVDLYTNRLTVVRNPRSCGLL